MQNIIFVFGSNTAGRHGRGAALDAKMNYGAIQGIGSGHYGNSYAIPTKGNNLEVLSLNLIDQYVNNFLVYARGRSKFNFLVTRVGCGLAGYTDAQIAPMFLNAPENCFFSARWARYL